MLPNPRRLSIGVERRAPMAWHLVATRKPFPVPFAVGCLPLPLHTRGAQGEQGVRWQVVELALFGSVLTADFGPQSDIDVLVRFHPGQHPTLFGLSEMESDLAELVGRPVDLVEREAVEGSPNYIRRRAILSSARTIYTHAT